MLLLLLLSVMLLQLLLLLVFSFLLLLLLLLLLLPLLLLLLLLVLILLTIASGISLKSSGKRRKSSAPLCTAAKSTPFSPLAFAQDSSTAETRSQASGGWEAPKTSKPRKGSSLEG